MDLRGFTMARTTDDRSMRVALRWNRDDVAGVYCKVNANGDSATAQHLFPDGSGEVQEVEFVYPQAFDGVGDELTDDGNMWTVKLYAKDADSDWVLVADDAFTMT